MECPTPQVNNPCNSTTTTTPNNSTISFNASAASALDVYYRCRIIYLCNEDECQIVSLNITHEGIKIRNYGAHQDAALPSCIHLPRTMFNVYELNLPSDDVLDIQVYINFTTLMDFLDTSLCDVSESAVLPLNIMFDKWLYISLQHSSTIGELESAINGPFSSPSERFCFVPGDLFAAITDTPQLVPSSPPPSADDIASADVSTDNNNSEVISVDRKAKRNEMMDNMILMLHPLNVSKGEEFSLVPTHSSSNVQAAHTSLSSPTGNSGEDNNSGGRHALSKRPTKRLKTTSSQVSFMEEWFKKDPLPSRAQRDKMVQQLGGVVSRRQLEVWFQNRRAKQKKKKLQANTTTSSYSPASPVPTTPTPSLSPSTPPFVKVVTTTTAISTSELHAGSSSL